MSKLIKTTAMLLLVFYGLASMHCILEGVPGFDFLKTCCFVDSASPAPKDCESDACVIESENYRAEEQTIAAPHALLLLALLSSVTEVPLPDPQIALNSKSESPPELPNIWQFSHRTALSPRAPSIVF